MPQYYIAKRNERLTIMIKSWYITYQPNELN